MSVIYWLVPIIIMVGVVGLVLLFWSVKSGQYDDLEGSSSRILMDDDDPKLPWNKKHKRNKKHKNGDGDS